MAMEFTVDEKTPGSPTWRLFSGNGQLVAWAGEAFASKSNAKRSAEAFKNGAATAVFEAYEDAGGHYRWRASRGHEKVAASGESFSSKASAERAMQNVRDNAGSATGPA